MVITSTAKDELFLEWVVCATSFIRQDIIFHFLYVMKIIENDMCLFGYICCLMWCIIRRILLSSIGEVFNKFYAYYLLLA